MTNKCLICQCGHSQRLHRLGFDYCLADMPHDNPKGSNVVCDTCYVFKPDNIKYLESLIDE